MLKYLVHSPHTTHTPTSHLVKVATDEETLVLFSVLVLVIAHFILKLIVFRIKYN